MVTCIVIISIVVIIVTTILIISTPIVMSIISIIISCIRAAQTARGPQPAGAGGPPRSPRPAPQSAGAAGGGPYLVVMM